MPPPRLARHAGRAACAALLLVAALVLAARAPAGARASAARSADGAGSSASTSTSSSNGGGHGGDAPPPWALRSNLYWGARTTWPDSGAARAALGWFAVPEPRPAAAAGASAAGRARRRPPLALRHACSDGDGLQRWGYTRADLDDGFAEHALTDPPSRVQLAWTWARRGDDWELVLNASRTDALDAPPLLGVVLAVSAPRAELGGALAASAAALGPARAGLRGSSAVVELKGVGGLASASQGRLEALFGAAEAGPGIRDLPEVATEHSTRVRRGVPPSELERTHYLHARAAGSEAWRVMETVAEQLQHSLSRAAAAADAREFPAGTLLVPVLPDGEAPPKAHRDRVEGGASAMHEVVVLERVLSAPFTVFVRFKAGRMAAAAAAAAAASASASASAADSGCSADAAAGGGACRDVVGERGAGAERELLDAPEDGDAHLASALADAVADATNRRAAFDAKFERAFGLAGLGFAERDVAAARAAVSNLVGSHTYFYGSNLIVSASGAPAESGSTGGGNGEEDGDQGGAPREGPPGALYTGVPSRAFFPRGFLWDEGFHQLLASRLSPSTSRAALRSWLSRFDAETGWVAREQILGSEALSRVPAQFVAQSRLYWNPPTLMLSLVETFAADGADPRSKALVAEAYAVLRKHRDWADRTQRYEAGPAALAWRGRSMDARHTLTSGIDDYPRGRGGGRAPQVEKHVDAVSWLAWLEGQLARVAPTQAEAEELLRSKEKRVAALLETFWNERLGFFNDVGLVDAAYPLEREGAAGAGRGAWVALVPHVGYVGLMPFCLELVPPTDTGRLSRILDALTDPALLKAPGVGVRSLARSDPLFGQDEDYWRGAVWININYLVVRAAHRYAAACPDPELRARLEAVRDGVARDVVRNALKQYHEFGFFFESYDGVTGLGRGTKPFTGWTALVVGLMREFGGGWGAQ